MVLLIIVTIRIILWNVAKRNIDYNDDEDQPNDEVPGSIIDVFILMILVMIIVEDLCGGCDCV